ncbi:hypothetical protein PTKIN_Ptkin02bG0236800 [Pterospermum kingtungense]
MATELKQTNSNTTTKSKATKGRQKIEIKKLENESSRQVTFTKRRHGLFKKASELCVLCGANIGIVVISTRGRPFCFGHPDVESILGRYLSGNPEGSASATTSGTAGSPCFEEFNEECREAMEKLEEEKRKSKEIEEEDKERKRKGGFWWDDVCVDDMGVEELEVYVKAMEELRNKVATRANEFMGDAFKAATAANSGGLENVFADQNGGLGNVFADQSGGLGSGYGDFGGLGDGGSNFGHGGAQL